jgi:hypothetical protein
VESAGRKNSVVVSDFEDTKNDPDYVKWVPEHKEILFPTEKMQKYFDS